jgi:hypothetical protein
MGFRVDPAEAFRGIQPGSAPGLFSSNLTNAIPLAKFKYSFPELTTPTTASTGVPGNLPPGMSASDYGFFTDPKIPSGVKEIKALMPPQRTLEEDKARWQAQADFMTQLENARGDRTQQYALVNSIMNSLGSIGRNVGSRYGSDPDSVAAAAQRMAALSAGASQSLAPLPNIPAVRYYNV